MYTKGNWIPDVQVYEKAPKEIITGIKVETDQPGYYQRIFDTILPDTDEQYQKEHAEISANVKLACAAPDLLEALKYCEEYIRRCLAIEGKCTQRDIDFILKQPREAIQKAQ